MQEREVRAVRAAETGVEMVDAGASGLEQQLFARQVLDIGVHEVAEDRKVNPRIAVGNRHDFEMIE